LVVPIIVFSALAIAFVGYYRYWVPNRQRHLDDRGFRYLKTVSVQVRLTINSFDKMMDYAVSSGVHSDEDLRLYLGNLAPQLVVVTNRDETRHIIGGDYDDPPKIAVKADEGTHYLYLAFGHFQELKKGGQGDPNNHVIRTDMDKLIDGLLGPPDLSPFDVVLVAQSDGEVIFQRSLSGIEAARIKTLEDASGGIKEKTDKQTDKQAESGLLPQVSRLEEVRIAGARYRLYSQPLQIGFLPANPNALNVKEISNVKSGGDATGPWILCGLVRADRFQSESQLIPYAYILLLLALILLAAAAYPFLRLYLSSPGERLRARDVTITAVFACLVTAVLTVTLADVYYWSKYFRAAAEQDMHTLASEIDGNFEQERTAAFKQLDAINARPDLKNDLSDVAARLAKSPDKKVTVHYYGPSHDVKCDPDSACESKILDDPNPPIIQTDPPIIQEYPYLFFVFWADDKGNQLVKWTTRNRPTPFIALDNSSVPYLPAVKRALRNTEHSGRPSIQGIGSQYSPTTGQNITVFWETFTVEKKTKDGKCVVEKKTEGGKCVVEKMWTGLVTEPVSVFNAVLPGGFQFAVLTPAGDVVFHSDPTRNLRENFFAETDQDPDLRSRVRMRSAGPVVADYMGAPHRMYVQPMAAANQDGQLTIVVFRDLHVEETMNLQILSLISIMFSLYAGAITIALAATYWIRRGDGARIWLWPDSCKTRKYSAMAMANLAAVVLILILSSYLPPRALLLCAGLIPLAVLLANVVRLRTRRDLAASSDQPDGTNSSFWQYPYFGVGLTLLLVVAVVPCLSFFKVAADYEHKLFIESSQMRLATELDNRDLAIQRLYSYTSLGAYKDRIMAGPETQNAWKLFAADLALREPLYSYHEFLETSVCSENVATRDSVEHSGPPIPDCHAPGWGPDENPFLSDISLSYNERAADIRHLAEGKSDVWKWTLSPSGPSRVLQMKKQGSGQPARVIASFWEPFYFPWEQWSWWLGTLIFLTLLYWLVRLSLTRIFLLKLVAPPPARDPISGRSPSSLMATLPMNLLIIGHESSRPIASLVSRSDVQLHDAEILLKANPAPAKPGAWCKLSKHVGDQIDGIIRNGRPLVLRNFDRLPVDAESTAKTHAALTRLLSAFGNTVIIISDLDPLSISSIEAREHWRNTLRRFVRIDLTSRLRQRIGEDDADFQSRVSSVSYFHWLFSGLSKPEKLVTIQLAQEDLVNPNSSEIVTELMEQGMIERSCGLLTVMDPDFAKFLQNAIPHHTVKHWEKEIAGARPVSIQTSLLILGLGVVAFLVYTQGDVFNTWVTYATGLAASVPKVLQLVDTVRSKSGAKA
jgi:hypothetical protein